MHWVANPLIYEINTWVWLAELTTRLNTTIDLSNVPGQEWDALAALGLDAVWLMGVWQRSPAGTAISNTDPELLAEFKRALPDYRPSDNVGSAYCIRDYVVDPHLGGNAGLAKAREELAKRGIRLILDFVPNHVAPDHPWVSRHPEFFIHGTEQDLAQQPSAFFRASGHIIAHGRDPYFPPWRDVAQLNAFSPDLRRAAQETLNCIAELCDGVRCDMAMLLLDDVFARTWGERAGSPLPESYWRELLPAVRAIHPDFIFIAETYWDLEWELMQQGFDYCYDKRLYDRLVAADAPGVRDHLRADLSFQRRLVRFIENHDEPRASSTFNPEHARVAAVTALTLPGARLLHDGQLQGRKVKLPVFLGRRPSEPRDLVLESFYRGLLGAVPRRVFREGTWQLCDHHGWSDNPSFRNIVAWSWTENNSRTLVVVNLSANRSQAMVRLPWRDLEGRIWRLVDLINGDVFLREGGQLSEAGLYVDLDAWRFHLLTFEH